MHGWEYIEREFRRYLLTSGKAQGTATTYCYNLFYFWKECRRYEVDPCDADRSFVRGYITERLELVSSNRAHNDLAALKCFYAFLRDTRYRDDDPTTGIHVKRAKTIPTEPLAITDLDRLIGACKVERDRVMFLILANTGLRISELANLKAEDVSWTRGTLKVWGKGDKEREVSPPKDVMERLHAFCGMFPSGPLFLSQQNHRALSAQQIRKILYDVAAKAGIENVHPHRFRAMYATRFIEQFADIQALQGALGHESIETTGRYSEWTKRQRGQKMMRDFRLTG